VATGGVTVGRRSSSWSCGPTDWGLAQSIVDMEFTFEGLVVLHALAGAATAQGHVERSAVLRAAIDSVGHHAGIGAGVHDPMMDARLQEALVGLDLGARSAADAAGRAMNIEEVVAYALMKEGPTRAGSGHSDAAACLGLPQSGGEVRQAARWRRLDSAASRPRTLLSRLRPRAHRLNACQMTRSTRPAERHRLRGRSGRGGAAGALWTDDRGIWRDSGPGRQSGRTFHYRKHRGAPCQSDAPHDGALIPCPLPLRFSTPSRASPEATFGSSNACLRRSIAC
jgi:hypothetical protein